MDKKEIYYNITEKFFEIGVLREVYSSENVSVCNLANSYYLATPFASIENNTPPAVITDVDGLKKIIEDNNYVYRLCDYYTKTNQDKYIVVINDALLKAFLPIKQKRDLNNSVSGCIDLDFEETLKQKNR